MLLFLIQLLSIVIFTIYYTSKFLLWYLFFHNEKAYFIYARQWSKHILKYCRIKVEVSGDISQKASSVIYVANHSSLFDIPVILGYAPDNIRIMYKKELEKIPIFGYGLKVSPCISVKREEARNAMNSIEATVASMKTGSSVLVYPEGTRTQTGELGEFKRGAFMLAIKSEKPIVPISLIGTFGIIKKGKFRFNPGIVKLIVGKQIIIPDSISRVEEKAIMAQVHDEIKNNQEKYR